MLRGQTNAGRYEFGHRFGQGYVRFEGLFIRDHTKIGLVVSPYAYDYREPI